MIVGVQSTGMGMAWSRETLWQKLCELRRERILVLDFDVIRLSKRSFHIWENWDLEFGGVEIKEVQSVPGCPIPI